MMKSPTLAAVGLAVLLTPCVASAVPLAITPGLPLNPALNLLTNGSFEGGFSGNPNLQPTYWATGTAGSPFQSITGWNTQGGPGNYAYRGNTAFTTASKPVPDGQVALYFGNGFATSISETPTFNPNGSLTFTSPNPTITNGPTLSPPVRVEQTVNGLSTNVVYALSFWASGEDAATGNNGHDGIFALDVTGFSTTYLAAPSGAPGGVGGQLVYRFEFVPVTSSVTIGFSNWGHFSGAPSVPGAGTVGWTIPLNTTELVLDHVILNQIGEVLPEPGSLATIGIAGTAMLRRGSRRRR
jgi:hypothetical protein